MLEQMEHERIYVTENTRDLHLHAADDAAVVTLLICAVRGLLLDVAFGQEDPAVSYSRLARMYIWINNCFPFVFLAMVYKAVGVTAEVTPPTLPDLSSVIHA